MKSIESIERFFEKYIHPKQQDTSEACLSGGELSVEKLKLLEVQSVKREALHLLSNNKRDLRKVAEIIKEGGVSAFPFNGVFGLFGDIDSFEAAELILEAKNRPIDKKLIQVCLPEHMRELVDLSKLNFREEQIIKLWKDIHALGLILPANTSVPEHLVSGGTTVLPIWTEYQPLRYMLEHFRKIGGRALVGTSANRMGEPTHWKFDELREEFRFHVHAVVEDDFSQLPAIRRRSTSIVDLTNGKPRLHREGNVTEIEIIEALRRNGFPPLYKKRDVVSVTPRE